MKKNIYIEITLNIILTYFIYFLNFFVSKYFLMVFGSQISGLFRLYGELLNYLELIEAGLASASTYALYKPLIEKNDERIAVLINTISYLYNRMFFIILFTGIILTPLLPYFIKDRISFYQISIYWILYLLVKAFNYLLLKYTILFNADQKILLVRFIQSGAGIISIILQIVVLFKFKSLYFYIMIPFFSFIIQYYLYNKYYKKSYKNIKKIKEKDFSIMKDLKNLIWHKFAYLLVVNTDIVLISKFISLDVVAIYGAYRTVNATLLTLFYTILGNIKPKIGKYIAENNDKNIYNLWKKINIYFLSFSFILVYVAYLLVDYFIILWIGESFLLPTLTKKIIYINLFIDLSRLVIESFKDGSGFFDDVHLPILEALINFIFSIILVKQIGLDGVLIGTLISSITILVIAKPILVFRKCFKLSIIDYIKMYVKYIILLILLVFISNYTINKIGGIFIKNWIDWIKNATFITGIVFLLSIVVFSIDKDFRKIYILKIKKLCGGEDE